MGAMSNLGLCLQAELNERGVLVTPHQVALLVDDALNNDNSPIRRSSETLDDYAVRLAEWLLTEFTLNHCARLGHPSNRTTGARWVPWPTATQLAHAASSRPAGKSCA